MCENACWGKSVGVCENLGPHSSLADSRGEKKKERERERERKKEGVGIWGSTDRENLNEWQSEAKKGWDQHFNICHSCNVSPLADLHKL